MSGSTLQPQAVQQALLQARLTGRPVPIPGAPPGLFAQPNGSVGPQGSGFGGSPAVQQQLPVPPIPPAAQPPIQQPVAPSAPFSAAGVSGAPGSPSGPAVTPPAQASPSWWQSLLTPNSGVDQGLNAGTPPAVAATQTQPPLNQANPNFTAGIQGLPGGPSGPAVAPPGGFPPPHVPDVVVTAKRYRQAHGLATPDDNADRLNAESLAAAQAGRNYWNPAMNVQPGGDVVNALTTPPTTQQPTQQVAQNLLQQGIY